MQCLATKAAVDDLALWVNHLIVDFRQTFVLRRAFQCTVVEIDADGRAVVEELRSPATALCPNSHQGILSGSARKRKPAIGNNRAVDFLFRQLVYQIDRLAVFSECTADGILYLALPLFGATRPSELVGSCCFEPCAIEGSAAIANAANINTFFIVFYSFLS